jgi:hypothetical protein
MMQYVYVTTLVEMIQKMQNSSKNILRKKTCRIEREKQAAEWRVAVHAGLHTEPITIGVLE